MPRPRGHRTRRGGSAQSRQQQQEQQQHAAQAPPPAPPTLEARLRLDALVKRALRTSLIGDRIKTFLRARHVGALATTCTDANAACAGTDVWLDRELGSGRAESWLHERFLRHRAFWTLRGVSLLATRGDLSELERLFAASAHDASKLSRVVLAPSLNDAGFRARGRLGSPVVCFRDADAHSDTAGLRAHVQDVELRWFARRVDPRLLRGTQLVRALRIAHCPRLTTLAAAPELGALRELRLSDVALGRSLDLHGLSAAPALEVLCVRCYADTRRVLFPDLAHCATLREVRLLQVKLRAADADLWFMRGCAALQTVGLQRLEPELRLDGEFLHGSRATLRTLVLDWGADQPARLHEALQQLRALEHLRMEGDWLRPNLPLQPLAALAQLGSLRVLDLSERSATAAWRQALLRAAALLPQLRVLKVQGNLVEGMQGAARGGGPDAVRGAGGQAQLLEALACGCPQLAQLRLVAAVDAGGPLASGATRFDAARAVEFAIFPPRDCRALAAAFAHAQVVSLSVTPVRSLAPLAALALLRQLRVKHAPALEELWPADAADACPRLQRLGISNVPQLRDLRGLGACGRLDMLELDTGNFARVALPGSLRGLTVTACAFQQPGGLARALRACARLELATLEGVTGVGALAELPAQQLRVLRVLNMDMARTLAGAAAAVPVVQLLADAALANLQTVQGALRGARVVNLDACARLRSIEALGACTALQVLVLTGCVALRSLTGLQRGPHATLETLHATGCAGLRSVEAVAGAPELRDVHLSGCRALADVAPLGSCPQLRRLALAGCAALRSVAGLASCAALRELDLFEVPLPVAGMDALPRLHVVVASPSAVQQRAAAPLACVVLDAPLERDDPPLLTVELTPALLHDLADPQGGAWDAHDTLVPTCFQSQQGSEYRVSEGGDGALEALGYLCGLERAEDEDGAAVWLEHDGTHVDQLGVPGLRGPDTEEDEESDESGEEEGDVRSLQSDLDDADFADLQDERVAERMLAEEDEDGY